MLKRYYKATIGDFPYELTMTAAYNGSNILINVFISRVLPLPETVGIDILYTPSGSTQQHGSASMTINPGMNSSSTSIPVTGSPPTVSLDDYGITSFSPTAWNGNPIVNKSPM